MATLITEYDDERISDRRKSQATDVAGKIKARAKSDQVRQKESEAYELRKAITVCLIIIFVALAGFVGGYTAGANRCETIIKANTEAR